MASKRAPKKNSAKIPLKTAERIVAIALQNPELGARRLVPLLEKKRITISATSVQNILRRHNLQTRALRLAKLAKPAKKNRRPKSTPKKAVAQISDAVAARICEIALQNPELGAKRLVPLLEEQEIFASSSSVYRVLKRNGIENRLKRLQKLKEQQAPETPPEFEIELPEPVLVPAHLAPMPPEDEIPEPVQDQEELPSLPIEDEIWEPVLGPLELTPVPDQDETTEPLPGPAEDEIPEPIFEPAVAAPVPSATEAPVPVAEPEPVPERTVAAPAESKPAPARKPFLKLPPQKSHWVFYPLYLLLLILIGYLGFQVIQTVQLARLETDAVAATDPVDTRPAAQPQAAIRPLSDYQVIWQRNLFNVNLAKDSDKKEEISLDKIALAKKDLGLELVGTVVADNPFLSRAIIDNSKTREQETYREGDNAGKVKIKRILRNNVIITTAKGDELLTVEIKESAKGSPLSTRTRTIGSGSFSKQQTPRGTRSQSRALSIELKRDEVESYFSNIDELMDNIKVTPYLQGNQPSGFRISKIPADSLLRKMGLRSRDVIVGVDDEDITSPDQAADFFQKLAAGDEVTIKVKRRRRTRQIKLNIQ